jgi:hypothetical protein
VLAALREGRAVHDPRDAPVAVAWAEYLNAKSWPAWVMPRTRPHGWKARAWVAHVVLILASVAWGWWMLWHAVPSPWRWVAVAFLAEGVITMPFTLRRTLLMFWNAPEAATKNRALLQATT